MFLKRVIILLLTLSISVQVVSASGARSEAAAAIKEGKLYIYSDLDVKASATLVKEFEALYPGIKVDSIAMTSSDVFSRHMNDIAARKVSADILWNSDVTLQASLVTDGYALKYAPVESSAVMPLANIGDTAYVTGFEPVVMAYNMKLVSGKDLPLTRNDLLKALKDEHWNGKLGACDPEKSALAFLLLTQDLAYAQDFWGLVGRFGDAGLKLYPDYKTLLDRIESGEVVAGYNLPITEVLKRAGDHKNIGWAYTTDYNLALPQSLLISKHATHPNAARLWVDFIRSKQAQQAISESCNLFPVRSDVAGGEMKKHGGVLPDKALRMIGTGAEVTRFNNAGLKLGFLLRWKQLLKLVK